MIKKCLCSLCACWGWLTQANALISGKGVHLLTCLWLGCPSRVPAPTSQQAISCSRTHAIGVMLMDCHVGSAHSNPLCRL